MTENDRIEAIISAIINAGADKSKELGCDTTELILATVNAAVRICLAASRPGEARQMMAALTEDYFGQADRNFEPVQ